MKTNETRHEALTKFLAEFYSGKNGQSYAIPEKSYNSTDVHKIPEGKIVDAVIAFIDILNIGSGSAGNFNLYLLLEAYLLVPEKRNEFNKLVDEALTIKRNNLLFKPVKKTVFKKSAK